MIAIMSRLLQGLLSQVNDRDFVTAALLLFLKTKGTSAAVGADGTARLDNCLIIATGEEMIELSTRTRLHVEGVGCGDLVVRRTTLAFDFCRSFSEQLAARLILVQPSSKVYGKAEHRIVQRPARCDVRALDEDGATDH